MGIITDWQYGGHKADDFLLSILLPYNTIIDVDLWNIWCTDLYQQWGKLKTHSMIMEKKYDDLKISSIQSVITTCVNQ